MNKSPLAGKMTFAHRIWRERQYIGSSDISPTQHMFFVYKSELEELKMTRIKAQETVLRKLARLNFKKCL